MAHEITTVEEYNNIISTHQAVFVDYFATWCKPCTQISPHIDAFQTKYPNIKIIKVNYDDFDSIAEDERIEKVPTFKAFFEGKEIGTRVGVKLDQLEALIGQLVQCSQGPGESPIAAAEEAHVATQNTTPSSVSTSSPADHSQPKPKKANMPAAHPALAIQNSENISKGSATHSHIPPTPKELEELKASLDDFSIVVFSHESQQPTTPTTVTSPLRSGLNPNVVAQLINDMKLLQARFSDINPIALHHIVLKDDDAKSDVLKFEFGLARVTEAPIIKMFYKKIVFATIMNANAYEVEAKIPDFVRL